MKTAKTLAIVSIITFSMTTSAFASWWNPFTWFQKKAVSVQQVQKSTNPENQPTSIKDVSSTTISILNSVPATPDVIPNNYVLKNYPATTTSLEFAEVEFAVPWRDLIRTKVYPSVGVWNFKNKETIFISVSTTTTKAVWLENPNIEKILPDVHSLSDYDIEKMVWRSHTQDAALLFNGKATSTEDVRKAMLAGIKTQKYSRAGSLLEFENKNGIKGLIVKWGSGGSSDFIVYFYTVPGHEYQMRFKADQDSIMDSIVSSIRIKK